MARAKKGVEHWLEVYAYKPLPRAVYVSLRAIGPSDDRSGRKVFHCFPTQGMLRAEAMGLAERFDPNDSDCYQWKRTPAGDTFFPERSTRFSDSYEEHVREQRGRAVRYTPEENPRVRAAARRAAQGGR